MRNPALYFVGASTVVTALVQQLGTNAPEWMGALTVALGAAAATATRAKVTPVADPRDNDGTALVPVDSPASIALSDEDGTYRRADVGF